jgi:hypothetical protein
LRTEAADAHRRLAAIGSERNAYASVNRVLSAADVLVVRLGPGSASKASGLVAISREAGSAIVEIAGLPAPAGQTCVLWWITTRQLPIKAAEFSPDTDGRVSLAVAIPPKRAGITGAIVTLESSKPVDQPRGRVMLRGVWPKRGTVN